WSRLQIVKTISAVGVGAGWGKNKIVAGTYAHAKLDLHPGEAALAIIKEAVSPVYAAGPIQHTPPGERTIFQDLAEVFPHLPANGQSLGWCRCAWPIDHNLHIEGIIAPAAKCGPTAISQLPLPPIDSRNGRRNQRNREINLAA